MRILQVIVVASSNVNCLARCGKCPDIANLRIVDAVGGLLFPHQNLEAPFRDPSSFRPSLFLAMHAANKRAEAIAARGIQNPADEAPLHELAVLAVSTPKIGAVFLALMHTHQTSITHIRRYVRTYTHACVHGDE